MITITVTEAGYVLTPDGALDLERDVIAADLDSLRADPRGPVSTLPAKLVAGLHARRAAGVGGLTVVSCDNLPDNGLVTRSVVHALATDLDEELARWIDDQVEFTNSVVDRITPATTDDDRSLVESQRGFRDVAPVPTEPFSEWVLAGAFAAGRPRWEDAGARVVADVAPFERRKLWLLNGSHSMLAYAGSVRGHERIDQAIADPDCRAWVELFWDEAGRHLDFEETEIADYRAALLERYANPRIRHLLAQIAADGSTKLPIRTLPIVRAERDAGRIPLGCATTLAAWVLHLRGAGAPVKDADAERVTSVARPGDLAEAVPAVLESLQSGLGDDHELVAAVMSQADVLRG